MVSDSEGALGTIFFIDGIFVAIGLIIWHFTEHQWWYDVEADKARLEAEAAPAPAPAPALAPQDPEDPTQEVRQVVPLYQDKSDCTDLGFRNRVLQENDTDPFHGAPVVQPMVNQGQL